MNPKQRQLANKYIDLFYRRKVFIVALLLLSLPIGLGMYLKTPKVYQATSLLSYQRQTISSGKMTRDVTARIRDIVSTITQIVTSRTNLEKLIISLDLYSEARKHMPMEDVVDQMRQKILIKPSSRGDIFKITFQYGSPDKVVKVTNAIAAKFIEENLKYREERATETFSYTSDELQKAKGVMDSKDSAMRDYKIQYYYEMPEQRITNVSRLISLQEQSQGKQESIQDLERTLVLIADQINNRKKLLEEEKSRLDLSGSLEKGNVGNRVLSVSQQIKIKKDLLALLLTRYTEIHPEVKRIKKQITRLEKKLQEADNTVPGDSIQQGETSASGSGTGDAIGADKILLQLETQRKNVLLNIKNIKIEKEQLKSKIALYEKRVAAAPVREAEWSSLTREYSQLKRHYEYLIAQDLEARSKLNLERRQKGSQFKIEDSARFPEKPIKPNFMMIMGMAVAMGLGAGFGGTLLLDFFDTTFRDPDSLESELGVELITTIPYIETSDEKKRRKMRYILAVCILILASGGIVALFAAVWSKGYIVI